MTMTKYKVFIPDKNGTLTFTKEELEHLLNEVYQEGYNDGNLKSLTITYGNSGLNQSSPYINTPYYTTSTTVVDAELNTSNHTDHECKCTRTGDMK